MKIDITSSTVPELPGFTILVRPLGTSGLPADNFLVKDFVVVVDRQFKS